MYARCTPILLSMLLFATSCSDRPSRKYDRIEAGFRIEAVAGEPGSFRFINESRNASTGSGPESMLATWDFGDGTKSYEVHPVHRFAEPGEYVVRLTVQHDVLLEANTASQPVLVVSVAGAEFDAWYLVAPIHDTSGATPEAWHRGRVRRGPSGGWQLIRLVDDPSAIPR